MDITFTCKCGQEIVIDEAGAGITVDCPGCGKPVYVPSKEPDKAKDIPVRVETPLAKLVAKQGQTVPPNSRRPPNPFLPAHKREDIHPSIQGGLTCLVIVVALALIGLVVMRENLFAAMAVVYVAAPFITAAPLCAIYGMCVGHVKHGLLLLAAMGLMMGLSYWMVVHAMFGQIPGFPH
jgi:hypothetical protein